MGDGVPGVRDVKIGAFRTPPLHQQLIQNSSTKKKRIHLTSACFAAIQRYSGSLWAGGLGESGFGFGADF